MTTLNILNKILYKLPSNLNDLEKARFLYLESCRMFTFSTKFQNTDDDSFRKMYFQKIDASNLDSTEVNCRIWSQIYSQLLYSANIKNEIIDNGHQHVKIFIGNEEWIADATYGNYTDLSRVKNKDKTVGFGYSMFQGSDKKLISIEEKYIALLDDIDKKLGYKNDEMEELIKFKKLLIDIKNGKHNIEQLSDEPIKDKVAFKLEYLFSHLGKLNYGYYEAKDYVYDLEMNLLDDDERTKVKAVELKRTNKDKSVDIMQCIYTIGDNPSYYLLAPNLPIIKITESHLMHLAVCGYGLDKGKRIIGIDYPRNFIQGEISKISRTILMKNHIIRGHIYSELYDYTTPKGRH